MYISNYIVFNLYSADKWLGTFKRAIHCWYAKLFQTIYYYQNIIRIKHDIQFLSDSLKRKDRIMIKMIWITLYQISILIIKLGNIFGCRLHYTNTKSLLSKWRWNVCGTIIKTFLGGIINILFVIIHIFVSISSWYDIIYGPIHNI